MTYHVEHPSVLKRLHGTFMVIAWLFFNSLGISVARYFKQTWINRQHFGVSRWIFYHRVYMSCCWILTSAAIIFIFIDLKGYKASAHAAVGLTTFAICFLQPILGLLSPPQQQARNALQFLHRIVGHVAYILAVTSMFLAVGLQAARISKTMYGLLAGSIFIHVLAHIMFNILEYLTRQKGVLALDANEDASFSRWRKTTLMLQMIGLYAFTFANVVYVWGG
ncbi:putative ferric-chelate reductase 1 homolog [Anopheles cruzii]|uniref:putative ferric-chelate reductase 1 homolog n=1 Tax=Anopheles cruzii TaxID=68878 RepID=UPI0022EC34AF|nr:putative ferric-chelate reductase 1 homolog [Anopheles cruzii]